MTKVLDTYWACGRSTIGIVRVQTEYDGIKYYIGSVPVPTTEEADARYIADWGSTFPTNVGDVLFHISE